MPSFLPYGKHSISSADAAAVQDLLQQQDAWLTCGEYVTKFEQKLQQITTAKYVTACCNGTAALHLALLAVDIGPGDIVIVPSVTFVATANMVRHVGADVLFADIDSTTGLITVDTLQQAIDSCNDKAKLKAVINVHFAGQCENLEQIYNLARKYNLKIIDDAAHALGTEYLGSPIGSGKYSDITTFSFHPVKNIATGEGGAVATNNDVYAKKIKLLGSHCLVRDADNTKPWHYEMHELGFNYRISDINCALGLSQLDRLESFIAARQQIVDFYDIAFKDVDYITPLRKLSNDTTAWHIYVVHIDFIKLGKSRAEVMHELKDHGIGLSLIHI